MVQNSHDGSALGIDLTGVTMDTEMTYKNARVRMSLVELYQKHPRNSVNFSYREGEEGLPNLWKGALFKGHLRPWSAMRRRLWWIFSVHSGFS